MVRFNLNRELQRDQNEVGSREWHILKLKMWWPTVTIARQCVPAMCRHVAVDDQTFHSGVEPIALSTDVGDLRAFCGFAVCAGQQVSNSWRLGTRQVR